MLSLLWGGSFAQPTGEDPTDPGAVSVSKVQDLNFGAFSANGSGTIQLANNGMRSSTGSVFLLNMGYLFFPAIFDVEAPEGTIISILHSPTCTLTGNNGGTITLEFGTTQPASPFTTTVPPPGRTQVSIGGTLNIGSSPPPGTYTGTFEITVHYQ